MAIEITVPRLGWSMEEGVFGQWLKRPGERVRPGEMLFVLEGDKSAQEIECFDDGYLFVPAGAPKPGSPVKVGQRLGWLLAENEAPPDESIGIAPSPAAESPPPVAAVASPPPDDSQKTSPPATSRRRASPRARRRAQTLGIDCSQVQGTGAGGRVRERDVLAASESGHRSETQRPRPGKLTPHTAARRLTAERMIASARETAPVTLTTTVDAGNLVNLREQLRSAWAGEPGASPPPGYTELVVKLAALVLREHPLASAQWREEGLFHPAEIDVAIAVDTDWGLVAPVIRGADKATLREIATQARELIDRARRRQLAPHESQDGVFTVTNLGSLGIDAFTPIVNLPQSAILGMGRIRPAPAVVDGRIEARHQLVLSLTFDHRVLDGAPAARFLQSLARCIENPAARLIG